MQLCHEKGRHLRVKGTIKLSRCDYTWIRFGAETKDGQFLFLCKSGNDRMQNRT